MIHKTKLNIEMFGEMIVNAAKETAHAIPYMNEIGKKVETVIRFGTKMEEIQSKKNTITEATTSGV